MLSAPRRNDRRRPWDIIAIRSTCPAFERTSKRRRGYPSETHVKRGLRFVHGDKELVEKLGRNDPCPCGSGLRFQAVLPGLGLLSMAPGVTIIGASERAGLVSPLFQGGAFPAALAQPPSLLRRKEPITRAVVPAEWWGDAPCLRRGDAMAGIAPFLDAHDGCEQS